MGTLFETALRTRNLLLNHWGQCLRLGNIRIRQIKRGQYTVRGVSTSLKGAGGPDRLNWRANFVMNEPSKPQNLILNTVARLIALLVHPRAIVNEKTERPFTSMREFLASNQARFRCAPSNVPVFLAPGHGNRCTRKAYTIHGANVQFKGLCRKAGLPGARLYNFRRGAATSWNRFFGPEATRALFGHRRQHDTMRNHCFRDIIVENNLTKIGTCRPGRARRPEAQRVSQRRVSRLLRRVDQGSRPLARSTVQRRADPSSAWNKTRHTGST